MPEPISVATDLLYDVLSSLAIRLEEAEDSIERLFVHVDLLEDNAERLGEGDQPAG